ncbi:MAG: hypothetical protein M3Z02_08130 [Actinomycetota bacterium]|nr:hypothetical protein [Actinomycetota bacterium]
MNPRSARRLAWGTCALSGLFVVGAVVFLGLNSFRLEQFYGWEPALGVAFPIFGALVASRRPENRVGWLMCAIGLVVAAEMLVGEYTAWCLSSGRSGTPGLVWVAWVNEWLWVPPFTSVLTLVLLLFPDGRPPSPRWRPAVAVAAVGICGLSVSVALHPGPLVDFPVFANPVTGPAVVRTAAGAAGAAVAISALAGIAALLGRFVRASGVERLQVKWFAFAAFAAVVEVAVAVNLNAHSVISAVAQFVAVGALPAAMGLAILRYRLYDIDRIISRTVSYAVLTGLLVGTYAALVTLVTRLLPASSSVAVAASTLVVAALFQPLRRRVQVVVDRRFNRARYDAEHTVEAFSRRLRAEVDLDSVHRDLLAVVSRTMEPSLVSLWLRPSVAVSR